jgi:hypothetical protein
VGVARGDLAVFHATLIRSDDAISVCETRICASHSECRRLDMDSPNSLTIVNLTSLVGGSAQ